jgi:hypothetical protein
VEVRRPRGRGWRVEGRWVSPWEDRGFVEDVSAKREVCVVDCEEENVE